jgi:hypothetical protein
LVAEDKLDLLAHILGIEAQGPSTSAYERESDRETVGRRTTFDFHLEFPDRNRIIFEVKYTEDGFGKAKPDDEHRGKFRSQYHSLATSASAFLCDQCADEPFFLSHYQLLRNLVHLDSRSYVVFIYPWGNTKVSRQATEAYDTLLTPAGRNRVKLVCIEDLVGSLESLCRLQSLAAYYKHAFRTKYLPPHLAKPASPAEVGRATPLNTRASVSPSK